MLSTVMLPPDCLRNPYTVLRPNPVPWFFFLGGEEGLENFLLNIQWDACPAVGNGKLNVVLQIVAALVFKVRFCQSNFLRTDG